MPLVSGCYCLDAFATEHCELMACEDIIVSTEHPAASSNVTILPNPSNGVVHINVSTEIQSPIYWKLFNQLGIEYQHGIITHANSQIDFGNEIPSGVYFIQLTSGQRQLEIEKIIIE